MQNRNRPGGHWQSARTRLRRHAAVASREGCARTCACIVVGAEIIVNGCKENVDEGVKLRSCRNVDAFDAPIIRSIPRIFPLAAVAAPKTLLCVVPAPMTDVRACARRGGQPDRRVESIGARDALLDAPPRRCATGVARFMHTDLPKTVWRGAHQPRNVRVAMRCPSGGRLPNYIAR